ncbi:MAG: FecR domain-containing protein [Candidatus Bipolaricaulia bacterium]
MQAHRTDRIGKPGRLGLLLCLILSLMVVSLSSVVYAQEEREPGLEPEREAEEVEEVVQPAPVVEIIELVGAAAVRSAGLELLQIAFVGMQLGIGDEIFVLDGSYVILRILGPGDEIELNEKTQIRINELALPDDPRSTNIGLLQGTLFAKVAEAGQRAFGAEDKFEVETESAVAAVRGTEFWGRVGSTEFGSITGIVDVLSKITGASVQLLAGLVTAILEDGSLSPPSEGMSPDKTSAEPEPPMPTPTPTPTPEPTPPPLFGGGGSGTVGTTSVGDRALFNVSLRPNFSLFGGTVQLGVNLNLWYDAGDQTAVPPRPEAFGFFADPVTGDVSLLPGDFTQLLQLIRSVGIETDPFGLLYGALDGQWFGEGLFMRNYSTNEENALRLRLGNRLGVEGLFPLEESTVVGLRGFWQPLAALPLQIGAQVVGNSANTIIGGGLDAIWTLGNPTRVYAQAGTYVRGDVDPNLGTELGVATNVLGIDLRAAYRSGNDFYYGFFDETFEVLPRDLDPVQTGQPDASQGVLVEAAFSFLQNFTAAARYERFVSSPDRLTAELALFLTENLQGNLAFTQTQVDFADLWNQDSLLELSARYPIKEGVVAIFKRTIPGPGSGLFPATIIEIEVIL